MVIAGACSSLSTHRVLIAFSTRLGSFLVVLTRWRREPPAPGRCYASVTPRCRATALTSTAACSRRARPNALRRTAIPRHSGVGCSHAPRPGNRCRGSGRRTTGACAPVSPSVAATTRSSADQLSVPRHPTQVRDGSARSPVRSATRQSTALRARLARRGRAGVRLRCRRRPADVGVNAVAAPFMPDPGPWLGSSGRIEPGQPPHSTRYRRSIRPLGPRMADVTRPSE